MWTFSERLLGRVSDLISAVDLENMFLGCHEFLRLTLLRAVSSAQAPFSPR